MVSRHERQDASVERRDEPTRVSPSDGVRERTRVEREHVEVTGSWALTPARAVALIVGAFLVILGAVALARAGIPASPGDQATVSVGWFTRTAVMGLIEIVIGLVFLAAAAVPTDRGGVTLLGVLAIVWGLIVLIEPNAFSGALGIGRETGVLYVAVGAAAAVAGVVSPNLVVRRTYRVD